MLEVRLLGQFEVRRDGAPIAIPARAAQSLLAYLILTAGTSHRREKLAGLLWPDTTEENARSNLRHELWRLRKAIETKTPKKSAAAFLVVDDISIGFDSTSSYWLDAALVQNSSGKVSADHLIETLSLYRGELLPGFYDEWAVLERERLRAAFEQKSARLLDLLQEEKRWAETLEWGERWIALGQTPEPAFRALMTAHAALGNMSQMASVYERCVRAMREDLGVEPSKQTRELFEQLSRKDEPAKPIKTRAAINLAPQRTREPEIAREPAAPIRSPSLSRSRLPVPPTRFIGREKELKEIAGLVFSSRLLTLTGSGGVGKTRLAIQTAHSVLGKFRDGVFWVDLVGLSDANLIPQEIAQSLRVSEVPNVPLIETLKNDLADKNLLLILDNCEHLIETAAQTTEQMLSASPHLKILATSRERLGIFNETVWRVPSLSENTRRQLFVERARAVRHDFTLTSANDLFVEQICARLDGIPLAIELAAARTAILSVEEIARRLDDRFSLLTSGSRTALPRQQTLRATLDWSYDLLTEPERTLFRRLAVFAGGFTLDAAEIVSSQEALKRNDVLDILGRLVDKSLVIVEQESNTGETRYHLLETIRQYALGKLEEIGQASAIRSQHLGYYLTLAEESEPNILSIESAVWYHRLDQELDNIRAAMEWSIRTGQADAALRILGSLAYFWFAHRPAAFEWRDWLQKALARPEAKERTLARAKALNGIGFMNWADFYPTDKLPELEEALSIGREFGDPWNTATALQYLGVLENVKGKYSEARTYLDQSLAIWREMGMDGKFGRAWTLVFLGDVALNCNEADLSRSLYEEVVTILRETGDLNFLAYAVRRLAQQLWRERDIKKAIALCKESLSLNQQVESPRGVIACLAGFAAIAVAMNRYEDAAQLMAAVEKQVASQGVRLVCIDRMEYDRNLALLKDKLDGKTLARFWSQGKTMTIEQAITYALSAIQDRRKSSRTAPNNLPVPLSSFIGREKEIEEIRHLLIETRLLTLTGAGGMGKTRLALKTATDLIDSFQDGVWWIDLVALTNPALVPHSLAAVLGVRELPDQPLPTTLANYLQSKRVLAVFDNCEHLIEACAQLAAHLLTQCPNLRILTTSREALGITGEITWRVPSLALPDLQHLPSLQELTEYAGIRLFVERARAVKTDFVLTEQNALPIGQICQRMDGMPLAIELAAARARTLSVRQIAERLDDRFNLLTQGSRAALPRHQTLRAAIDWSYGLLSEPEAILFRRLSVFTGGWTLEAAEAVCAGEGLEQSLVLELLSRLVDKSLVVTEERDSAARYAMLEMIREYAREKLEESGEASAAHRHHLEFFAQLADEAEPKLLGGEQVEWFNRLELERGNWRAALDWAMENGKADWAMRIAGVLVHLWFHHGPLSEGQERLRQILDRPEAREPSRVRARALNGVGLLNWGDINMTGARAQVEEALAIGQKLGDRYSIATSLSYLGLIANLKGDYRDAHPYLEQSLALGRELGAAGRANNGQALLFLGELGLNEGDYAQAQTAFEQSLAILQDAGDGNRMAYAMRRLGQLAWYRGDVQKAAALCRSSLSMNAAIEDRRGVIACIAAFGGIALAQGQLARAAQLFGAVDSLLSSIGARMLQSDTVEYQRNLATAREQQDSDSFAAAWAEGQRMSMDQAVAFALQENVNALD